MSSTTPNARQPAHQTRPEPSGDEASRQEDAEEARRFYEWLEQTGQLLDVTTETDVTTLPPRITHVHYPDGTIKRIGFA
jgi:hypothetical protein